MTFCNKLLRSTALMVFCRSPSYRSCMQSAKSNQSGPPSAMRPPRSTHSTQTDRRSRCEQHLAVLPLSSFWAPRPGCVSGRAGSERPQAQASQFELADAACLAETLTVSLLRSKYLRQSDRLRYFSVARKSDYHRTLPPHGTLACTESKTAGRTWDSSLASGTASRRLQCRRQDSGTRSEAGSSPLCSPPEKNLLNRLFSSLLVSQERPVTKHPRSSLNNRGICMHALAARYLSSSVFFL